MAMGKRREMEEQTILLNNQIEELKTQLSEYRSKEQAIVLALTEAQSTAARRIAKAEEQARAIINEAERKQSAMAAQSERMRREANEKAAAAVAAANEKAALTMEAATRQAAETTAAAEQKAAATLAEATAAAKERLEKTEQIVADYGARAEALNAALCAAADRARKSAAAFVLAAERGIAPVDEIVDEAGRGLSALILPKETPADYETPAALMHSIYNIQNRDIPEQAEATQPAPEPPAETAEAGDPAEERVWTVDEVMASARAPEAAKSEKAQEATTPPIDLNDLLDEIFKD